MQILPPDHDYILNYCAKHLARGSRFSATPGAGTAGNLSVVSEAWRYPVINSYGPPGTAANDDYLENEVIFIYPSLDNPNAQVSVIGTFSNLFEPIPLTPVLWQGQPSGYFSLTVVLPVERCYRYRFIVDRQPVLDPVNPQRVTLLNGKTWSRFFTDFNIDPVSFERWELDLLQRLVEQILPFRTPNAENFLGRFYNNLSPSSKQDMMVYQMDQSVGEVNYIDNIVAREEGHHLVDYKLCLEQIDSVLRQRNPFEDPDKVSKELIIRLYDEMASGNVMGWNYSRYADPAYFLRLLRRHAVTGAFSHPKYGGNVAGAGWAYLSERYTGKDGKTLFDWRASIETPLGVNTDYLG